MRYVSFLRRVSTKLDAYDESNTIIRIQDYDANELEEDDAHSDNEILDDERQVLQAHILDEEETASRDLLDNPVRRSNGIIRGIIFDDSLKIQREYIAAIDIYTHWSTNPPK